MAEARQWLHAGGRAAYECHTSVKLLRRVHRCSGDSSPGLGLTVGCRWQHRVQGRAGGPWVVGGAGRLPGEDKLQPGRAGSRGGSCSEFSAWGFSQRQRLTLTSKITKLPHILAGWNLGVPLGLTHTTTVTGGKVSISGPWAHRTCHGPLGGNPSKQAHGVGVGRPESTLQTASES